MTDDKLKHDDPTPPKGTPVPITRRAKKKTKAEKIDLAAGVKEAPVEPDEEPVVVLPPTPPKPAPRAVTHTKAGPKPITAQRRSQHITPGVVKLPNRMVRKGKPRK